MDTMLHTLSTFFISFSRLSLISLLSLVSILSACGGDDDDGDTAAPIVTIDFPPPASMTEGEAVRVRGTAMDGSGVSSVEVNGLAVTDTSDDGSFSTWEIVVNLVEGENTVTVSATDSEENMDSEAASVMVKRDPNMGDFPNSDVPIGRPISFAIDYQRNRLLFGDGRADALLAMDLDTGVRSEVSTPNTEDLANPLRAPEGLFIDSEEDVAWIGDSAADAVFRINLINGNRALFSNNTLPNDLLTFSESSELIEDPNDSDYLLITDGNNGIKRVNKLTGQRSIFSDGVIPNDENDIRGVRGIVLETTPGRGRILVGHNNGITSVDINTGEREHLSNDVEGIPNTEEPFIDEARGLALDTNRNRLLVVDFFNPRIVAVDLDTGERSVFSDGTTPDSFNAFGELRDIFYDVNFGYLFVGDDDNDAIMAVDIISGERVFVSVGKEPIP